MSMAACACASTKEKKYFIGVDVGTGSVRAGLFSAVGKLVSHSIQAIQTWRDEGTLHSEQSSTDIWAAVTTTVKAVCEGIDPALVQGIGFDATCSLVAVSVNDDPVTVSVSRDPQRNVILWQDHRAVVEAEEINAKQHPVLKFVGGKISVEMQPPKLLWLKRNLREECWNKAGHFFDLVDYLTYRATGELSRSLCCLVCKWTYIGHQPVGEDLCYGWNASFWEGTGLPELVTEGYSRIGTTVLSPGSPVGGGLSPDAASELGLPIGLPVATGIIDAHAGGLGMIGACVDETLDCPLTSRCALIAGTSACHMATSPHPIFVPGVWGPYFSAMCPGLFLNEGGQSSTGQLTAVVWAVCVYNGRLPHPLVPCDLQIDHVLNGYHTDVLSQLKLRAEDNNCTLYTQLELELQRMAGQEEEPSLLTKHLHISPDFIGNRSPLADPEMLGMCTGVTLGHSVSSLARLYLATIQALAYSTRLILETMCSSGHQFQALTVCGGLRQNRLYLQTHSDVTGLPVLLTEDSEAVLLGSAILAAAASGTKLEEAMQLMSRISLKDSVQPNRDPKIIEFHRRKFAVFKELYKDQLKYRALMN